MVAHWEAMSTTPVKGGAAGDDGRGEPSRLVAVASAGSVEVPMLTRVNYHDWSLVMQVSLEALGLWDAVESDKVERRDDRLELAAILRGVPAEMKARIATKNSAKEAWAAIKTARMGDNRVKEANAQRLMKEFENFAHIAGESVEALVERMNKLVGNLREHGEKLEDKRVIKKILRVMPSKYTQIVLAIEMFGDLDSMTIEGLVGRLRAVEDRVTNDEAAETEAGMARLLLTEEQWEARRHQRSGKEKEHRGGSGGARSGKHAEDDDDVRSTTSEAYRCPRGRCFICDERGHIAKYCPERRGGKALLVDTVEEPTLL